MKSLEKHDNITNRLQDEVFPVTKKRVEVEKKEGESGFSKLKNPDRPLKEKEKQFVMGMQQTDPNVFGGKNVEELTKADFVRGGGRKKKIKEQVFAGIVKTGVLAGIGKTIMQNIRKA